MRNLCLIAVLFLFALPLSAAEPSRPPTPEQKARAALALAAAGEREAKVEKVLAKIARDEAEAVPVVAPAPRVKSAAKACDCAGGTCDDCPACECPVAAPAVDPLPAPFLDVNGCTWTPYRMADGRVGYTRTSCPARR